MADEPELLELEEALRRVRDIYTNELPTYRKRKRETSSFGEQVEHPGPASWRSP